MTTTNLGKVSVTPKGEYDPLVTYERLDIVNHNGSSYIVKQASTGVTPIEGEFYALIAEKGDGGSFVKKAYKTYAAMDADKVNIPANSSVDVTNDPDESKNGAYIYNGVAFTRSQYDSKVVTDKIIADAAVAVNDAINDTVISSGFVTIDSFELGATITQRNQALRHTASGELYRWAGDLPKVVPENSTPESSGGLGSSSWLEVSDATLRQDINSAGGLTKLANAQVAVDTLADLVAANWLKVGMIVSTKGYYAANDGGGNAYEIVAAGTGVADGGGFVDLTTTNLQAKGLFPGEVVSVLQFGAKPNVEVDQLSKLQAAVNLGYKVDFGGRGIFSITPTGILFKSGQEINMKGSGVKLLPHNQTNYNILRIHGVSDLVIHSPFTDGNRVGNSATGGEWGMGLSILGAKNIVINNPKTRNCWGDGVYIAGQTGGLTYSDNITINHLDSDNDRRQGVSVVSAKNLTIYEPKISRVRGTNPQAGIDLEPNNNSEFLENINIVRPNITDCENSAITVHLAALSGALPKVISVNIESPFIDGCLLSIGNHNPTKGSITGAINVINPRINNTKNVAINFRNLGAEDGLSVNIYNPVVSGSNTSNNTSGVFGSVFSINADPGIDYDIGGVTIINPIVLKPANAHTRFVSSEHSNTAAGFKVKNVNIIDPVYLHPLSGGRGSLLDATGTISDKMGKWVYTLLGSSDINSSLYAGSINTGLASTITLTETGFVDGSPDLVFVSSSKSVSITTSASALFTNKPLGMTRLVCNANFPDAKVVIKPKGEGKFTVVSKSAEWVWTA